MSARQEHLRCINQHLPRSVYQRVAGSQPTRSKGQHLHFLSKRPEASLCVRARNSEPLTDPRQGVLGPWESFLLPVPSQRLLGKSQPQCGRNKVPVRTDRQQPSSLTQLRQRGSTWLIKRRPELRREGVGIKWCEPGQRAKLLTSLPRGLLPSHRQSPRQKQGARGSARGRLGPNSPFNGAIR